MSRFFYKKLSILTLNPSKPDCYYKFLLIIANFPISTVYNVYLYNNAAYTAAIASGRHNVTKQTIEKGIPAPPL
jgi:hypothetical protein